VIRCSESEFLEEVSAFQERGLVVETPFASLQSAQSKVRVVCKVCGNVFTKTLAHLRSGDGCPKCAVERLRITELQFLELKMKVFEEKRIQVLAEYKDYEGARKALNCVCLVCGTDFKSSYSGLKQGHGCRKCAIRFKAENQRTTELEFLEFKQNMLSEKSIVVLKDFAEYRGSKSSLSCKCLICGSLFTSNYSRLQKRERCPNCSRKRMSVIMRLPEQKFLEFKEICKERGIIFESDYSAYDPRDPKINCRCSVCGSSFQPLYGNLQQGHGCTNCANGTLRLSEEEYEKRVALVEKGQQIRVLTPFSEYTTLTKKSDSLCLKCGMKIRPIFQSLFTGIGCGECWKREGTSKEEDELFHFVSSEFPELVIERNTRDVISPLEIDIFLPQEKVGIEYHGLYWHSEKVREKCRHQEKHDKALSVGVKLIQIFSDEWEQKREVVQSMIIHALGGTKEKVSARKCNLVSMTRENRKRFIDFFERNHISGWTRCFAAFGLEQEGRLVEAISFRRPFIKKYGNVLELARSCVRLRTSVPGGFSKVLKFARLSLPSLPILSYSDLRFGEGEIYLKNGFELVGRTSPDYFYTDFKNRYNRFTFRAKNGLTEKQVADQAGVSSIYGVGHKIYLLPAENPRPLGPG
jgi:Zn finger protein HypA/HybF involved in hydrogenase expression